MRVVGLLFILFNFISCSSSSQLEHYPRYTDTLGKDGAKQKVSKKIPNFRYLRFKTAPGFRYRLYHPSDKKLQGYFRSNFQGVLRLPYNVVIQTKDRNFKDVKQDVLKAYHKFFQKGVAGVSFSIATKTRWVEVRGLVKKPGKMLITANTALDSIISKAGGVKGDISKEYYAADITQHGRSYSVVLNEFFEDSSLSKKITWLGGDTIFVKRVDLLSDSNQLVSFVTILGGVTKPGKILFQKNASLYYFIEKSGGLITGLAYNECFVFRKVDGALRKIQFDFSEPETIPVIMPGDTIYMNSSTLQETDIWLQRLSNVTAVISTVALLIIAL